MSKSSAIKAFILAALVLAFAFLFWQNLANFYLKLNFSLKNLIYLGLVLIFFLIFLLFFSLLANRGTAWLIYLISLGSFFLFFKFHYYFLIGLGLFFIALIISRALMQKEKNERLKISLKNIWQKGLPLILTFLALFIALISYFYPLVKIDQTFKLPNQILVWLIKPFSQLFGKFLPFYEAAMTIDEMIAINLVLADQRNINLISPEILKKVNIQNLKNQRTEELFQNEEIRKLLQEESKKLIKKIDPKILSSQREELAKALGMKLKGSETLIELVNAIINIKLQEVIKLYRDYVPIGLAIITFFLLKILFIFLGWIVIVLALLIFQFLKIIRFVKIEKVMKEGEDVRL